LLHNFTERLKMYGFKRLTPRPIAENVSLFTCIIVTGRDFNSPYQRNSHLFCPIKGISTVLRQPVRRIMIGQREVADAQSMSHFKNLFRCVGTIRVLCVDMQIRQNKWFCAPVIFLIVRYGLNKSYSYLFVNRKGRFIRCGLRRSFLQPHLQQRQQPYLRGDQMHPE